jgi:hypothetical protein
MTHFIELLAIALFSCERYLLRPNAVSGDQLSLNLRLTIFYFSLVLSNNILPFWDNVHQIVIRTLSRFCYLCQQLAYFVLCRKLLIASQNGEALGSYQEYPSNSGWQERG